MAASSLAEHSNKQVLNYYRGTSPTFATLKTKNPPLKCLATQICFKKIFPCFEKPAFSIYIKKKITEKFTTSSNYAIPLGTLWGSHFITFHKHILTYLLYPVLYLAPLLLCCLLHQQQLHSSMAKAEENQPELLTGGGNTYSSILGHRAALSNQRQFAVPQPE